MLCGLPRSWCGCGCEIVHVRRAEGEQVRSLGRRARWSTAALTVYPWPWISTRHLPPPVLGDRRRLRCTCTPPVSASIKSIRRPLKPLAAGEAEDCRACPCKASALRTNAQDVGHHSGGEQVEKHCEGDPQAPARLGWLLQSPPDRHLVPRTGGVLCPRSGANSRRITLAALSLRIDRRPRIAPMRRGRPQ
jgi:hypothetical protein